MKTRTKIISYLLLISALSILLTGCLGLPDDSPGYTPGSITGRIMIPNQCASCVDDGPCLPKGNGNIPSHWVPAEEAIVTVIPHAALTDEDGYYTLSNVEPGVYYVITATIGGNLVLKDVVLPDGVEAGKTYDAGTADCYSTALGLVVEYFIDSGLTTEEIDDALEMYVQDSKFDQLVETVCCIIEDCDDITGYCCLVECDPPGFTCDATSISLDIPSPDCDVLCTTIGKPITVKFDGKDDVVINDFNDPRLDWDIPGAIDFDEGTGELCLDGSLGTYNIRVTYVDPIPDSCGSVSRTVPVTFSACSCPVPTDVDAGGPYSDTVAYPEDKVTVDFNGSATGTGTLTYDWDFGDGTILTDAGPTPSHTYQYPFTGSPYSVILTVTNECGSATDTANVNINYVAGFKLTVQTEGNGSVSVDPNETNYPAGTIVGLNPVADSCWYFDHWEEDLSGTSAPGNITMNSDKVVTAVFYQSPTADIVLTPRYDLPGEDCEDTWLWWHKPCNHTRGRDYMEIDVEIKNATSSIDSVNIQIEYETGIGGLDECSTSLFDGNNDGIFSLNSKNKTSVRFKKYGPDSGYYWYNPTEDGSDWKDYAVVKVVENGTSIIDSEGHQYCLNLDSIKIYGDDNQIRNK